MSEYILFSENHEETFKIGKVIGDISESGAVYALLGELGAGKTVLTKGIAEGLKIEEEPSSPTFVIMNVYEGILPLYHFDLYRITETDELDLLGYTDFFYSEGVCVIEWADKIIDELPKDAVIIEVSIFENKDEIDNPDKRILRIKGSSKWVSLFKNTVEQALQT